MYAVLIANITIGQLVFQEVHSVEITRSVDVLSDTATIKIPRALIVQNYGEGFEAAEADKVISIGDEVTIQIGYEDLILETEFKGYVKQVKPTFPVEVECEDAVWKLRRSKDLNKIYKNIELRDLLKDLAAGSGISVSTEVPSFKLERFQAKNITPAQVLQKIKEEFGLAVYIDDNGHLFAGLRQQLNALNEQSYHFQENILPKHDLTFIKEEDLRLRVKVIGIAPDNTRVTVIIGDDDGELRTFFRYNVTDKQRLTEIAQEMLKMSKFTGYRGSFTSFLYPNCQRGWSVNIEDDNHQEMSGKYFVEKTKVTYGTNGARRQIFLGEAL
jgi:hypothetical protein